MISASVIVSKSGTVTGRRPQVPVCKSAHRPIVPINRHTGLASLRAVSVILRFKVLVLRSLYPQLCAHLSLLQGLFWGRTRPRPGRGPESPTAGPPSAPPGRPQPGERGQTARQFFFEGS
jgi:hypothetical protein